MRTGVQTIQQAHTDADFALLCFHIPIHAVNGVGCNTSFSSLLIYFAEYK